MDVKGKFPNRDIEVYPLTAASLGVPEDWFASGNFCSSAGTSFAEGWHSAAAMGLIGRVNAAVVELEKEDSDEARFYLGAAEVIQFRDDAWQTYFTNPKYLDLVEKKFGRAQRLNVEDMAKVPLHRKLLEVESPEICLAK